MVLTDRVKALVQPKGVHEIGEIGLEVLAGQVDVYVRMRR